MCRPLGILTLGPGEQKTLEPASIDDTNTKKSSDRAATGSPQSVAIYRALGHENALPFGEKDQQKRRRVIFSDDRDGKDESNRFDAMRPED
jgi:hypothetical protein